MYYILPRRNAAIIPTGWYDLRRRRRPTAGLSRNCDHRNDDRNRTAPGATVTIITRLALSRKPVTIMVMLLALAGGIYGYNRLQQELFPDITFGSIVVWTGYAQGDPITVASEVTAKIEDAIIGMADLDRVTSISTANTSIVTANFVTGSDEESAEDEITSRVSGLNLPDDAGTPNVIRITTDIFPVMRYSVTGDRDIPALRRVIDDQIVPPLEAIAGVYDVTVQGGITERVSVIVDPESLDEYDLSIQSVVNAVAGNSIDLNAGAIEQGNRSLALRTYHGYTDLDAIRRVPVGFKRSGAGPGIGNAVPIPLSDVARVVVDTPQAGAVSRTNGQTSISVSVLRLPDGNTIEVTDAVLDVVAGLELPPDVNMELLENSGPPLREELTSVMTQGAQGFGIAVLAIFLFLLQIRPSAVRGILNTLRPTLIIAISIPLSVMVTMIVMAVFDWTLNFMSLAGLAIAVGRIVDDSIVVLENTYRHVQAGEPRSSAAIRGAHEVAAAIVGSTLTTVAVFLPLAFIPGAVGQFFLPFAQTVCVSLLASTLIALTAVPVLGSALLRRNDMAIDDTDTDADAPAGARDHSTWLQRIYTPPLVWALRHRLLTILGCIIVVAASLALITQLPITLFSEGETESVRIDITMPEGANAAAMFREVRQVEQTLEGYRQAGQIESYQVTLGATSENFGPSTGEGGYDVAGFFIPLPPDAPTDLVRQLRQDFPDRDGVAFQVSADQGGPLQAGLEATITGADFSNVQAAALQLLERIEPVPGLVNVKTNISDTAEEITFAVDLDEAGRYGLDSRAVATQVRYWVYGADAADINLAGDTYDVIVRGRDDAVDAIDELQRLNIGGPRGNVPLGAVSAVKSTVGPSIVTHYNGDRSVTISGTFEGQDTEAISSEVSRIIAATPLPPGVTVHEGGFASDIQEQFNNVYVAMIIGVSLVYLVMVASLGSLRDPFIVVLSMPLAVVGALIALYVTGRALSLPALMGFLFLIGIVVTNAIVLITFVNQLRAQGAGALEAMIEAGRTRLRPILMTAFTTILAILPLAFSDSNGLVGAELATVVIGGLVSSTFLTLMAVPVTYMLFHESIPHGWARLTRLVTRRPAPPRPSATPPEPTPQPAAAASDD